MKYSHNSYWNNKPIEDTIEAGMNAIEIDIVYSLFRNEIFVSHSWRPFKNLYYCELGKYLFEIQQNVQFDNNKIKYVILESKSFWININKLYDLLTLNFYPEAYKKIIFVMSVQSRYPHQWIRGIWLKSFYKKYKKDLGILDKRTETNLNEQVNLYPKYNWFQRIINNQF